MPVLPSVLRAALVLAVAAWVPPVSAQSDAKACAVVLLHGKPGSSQAVAPLARRVQPACLARAVEMPWSSAKADAPPDLSRLVRELKRQGYKRVVVAGQGVGANAALSFAGRTGDADAVVAIGGDPAPNAEGLGELPALAAGLRQHTPLLWLIGDGDPLKARGEAYAFAKAPPHPNSRYEEVKADPESLGKALVEWIRGLD